MKNLIIFFTVLQSTLLFGQNVLTGNIKDSNGEPLIGASVLIQGTATGTTTNLDGNFELKSDESLPYTIEVSYIGFESQTKKISEKKSSLNIVLKEGVTFGQEIVVSASREAQKITEAPATIAKIDAAVIEQTATSDPFISLATTKGVEYNRKGVGVIDFNIRGFNTSFNPRNKLIVDGRPTNLIAFGLPYLQLTPLIKDDIDNIEVVLGPSSALYGFGASNGLVNITTKDPRVHPGTTVALGAGNQSQLNARVRHASKMGENSGYKIAFSYSSGQDFEYTDSSYYTISENIAPIANQPGVAEFQLDPDFEIINGDLAVYSKVGNKTDLVFSGGVSTGKFIQTTGIGRNQFSGLASFYGQVKLIAPRWYAQVSNNINTTTNDDSKVLSVLTDNLQSYQQFAELTGDSRLTEEFMTTQAQDFRLLRILPDGTLLELPVSSRYKDNSNRLNSEIQYNNRWGKARFIGGAQYNLDNANSLGTFLLEKTPGESVQFSTIGAYAQLEYKFTDKFKTVLAARGDQHNIFGFNFAPKLALVKVTNKGFGAWRLTYGRGIVAPTPLQAELSFAGGRLLGNSEGYTILNVDYVTGETSERVIDPLVPELLDAIELGYKNRISDNVFFDVNVFYNNHTNFITNAVTEIASTAATVSEDGTPLSGNFVINRGDDPISDLQQPLFSAGLGLSGTPLESLVTSGIVPADASLSTQTYLNYGNIQTYGMDVGFKVQMTEKIQGVLNYSFFDSAFDENDLENDLNGDGKVEEFVDIQVNSPNHKANLGLKYNEDKYFIGVNGRYVSAFNYFAGNTVATETIPGITYAGFPVVENQQINGSFNEGPLGGFVNVDFNAGYTIADNYTISATVTNVFDAAVRDFVTSPTIGRLFNIEVKAKF